MNTYEAVLAHINYGSGFRSESWAKFREKLERERAARLKLIATAAEWPEMGAE